MKLVRIETPEPAVCRMILTADAAELAQALAAQPAAPAPQPPGEPEAARRAAEDARADRMAAAVNQALLAHFPAIYGRALAENGLEPVTDPEFDLISADEAQGFCASAEFFLLPELTLGRYTGFTQAVEPRPLRALDVELEVNRNHADEDRAADAAGQEALRRRVAAALWEKRCAQALVLARARLVYQLGAEVHGALPKMLVHGSYFAEQRRFSVNLQMKNLNFDVYLQQRGMDVEQFRAELHAEAEQRLRSRLGLLLVARREGLTPTRAEAEELLARWDTARNGARTFYENDLRRAGQELAGARAADFIAAHSTLVPPPETPVIVHTEKGPQA
jgi:FKBP-type peptidyl-prolyl cis-trans isomerase (trigger factor)